ncbi:MAG: hypothetical protein WA907_10850 [Erythrobacter sp.]
MSSPFARSAVLAAGALTLAACSGEATDDEVPYNEGNTEAYDTETFDSTEDAVPAPEGVDEAIEVPINDDPGVTPNTVDGVGSDDADADPD